MMPKVLVVDDSALVRAWCSQVLHAAGCLVIEAANGAEAVGCYKAERPDLVLMDITMPVMDGIAATAEILRHHPSARVVIFSALDQEAMVAEARQAGAAAVISKPPQPAEVQLLLEQWT